MRMWLMSPTNSIRQEMGRVVVAHGTRYGGTLSENTDRALKQFVWFNGVSADTGVQLIAASRLLCGQTNLRC